MEEATRAVCEMLHKAATDSWAVTWRLVVLLLAVSLPMALGVMASRS